MLLRDGGGYAKKKEENENVDCNVEHDKTVRDVGRGVIGGKMEYGGSGIEYKVVVTVDFRRMLDNKVGANIVSNVS